MAGDPMGSIDLHQSAGLCAQPEATQDNPQNLSTTRTTVLCYVYQTHPHTKEKKAVWLRETSTECSSLSGNQAAMLNFKWERVVPI